LAARVRNGETLDAVAAASGARVIRVANLDRQSAAQNQTLSQDLLGKTFAARPDEVVTADNSTFRMEVAKLERVSSGQGPTLARMTEETRPQMTMALFRELGEAARTSARQKLKVKTDYALARTAIGLQAEAEAPAGKSE